MARADVAITSGGRTVLELASLGVPTLVICQNQRETTHTFAGEQHGVMNLGFHGELADGRLKQAFAPLLDNQELRRDMRTRAPAVVPSQGKARVRARHQSGREQWGERVWSQVGIEGVV